MSSNDAIAGQVKVTDDEGLADRKVKEHILALRKQVDEDERRLFVELAAGEGLSRAKAEQYWGVSVRQYLRGIKRLWNGDAVDKTPGVRNVKRYWTELHIGDVTLVPPDTDGYPFSLVTNGMPDSVLRRRLGLPRGASLPEPETVSFEGLRSVLDRRTVTKEWVVTTDDSGPPPTHEFVTARIARPVPKHILEAAIETADNFLQQAGIGFETTGTDYYAQEPGL